MVTLGYLKNAQQIQTMFEDLEEKIKNNIDKIFVIPQITENVNTNNNPEVLVNNAAIYEKPKFNQIDWKLRII